jgi:hypothetical protein
LIDAPRSLRSARGEDGGVERDSGVDHGVTISSVGERYDGLVSSVV